MPNRYPAANEANTTALSKLHSPPGKITRGPGNNKPRIHLVSSKGKIPAAVYAEAIAQKQKNQAANAAGMPKNNAKDPYPPADVRANQLKNPSGVAPRPNPPHQRNPVVSKIGP